MPTKKKTPPKAPLTVSELEAKLASVPDDYIVCIHNKEYYYAGVTSWRSNYLAIAIDVRTEPSNAKTAYDVWNEMKSICNQKIALEGYKGGWYTMNSDTPVWVSPYGEMWNWATSDIVVNYEEETAYIQVVEIRD